MHLAHSFYRFMWQMMRAATWVQLSQGSGQQEVEGRLSMPRAYIMVCDERGTTRWPSRTKTWAMGGFVIDSREQGAVVHAWKEVKLQLCGASSCELKWSHFFPGRHQNVGTNPLVSDDPEEWREQARWAIDRLFEVPGIVPVNMYVRKDEASDAVFEQFGDTSTRRYKVLDIDTLFVGVVAQFALFLTEHRARGEIWFDKLGSLTEEQRKQASWQQLRDGEATVTPKNRELLKRVSPHIRFFDSRKNELVQVADFVSGVIWAAAEGDEQFLLQALSNYFPSGSRTHTLLWIK
jgi:hypothetical protein